MQVRLISWLDASTALGNGTVDVGLLWLPPVAPDVEARVLLREPRSVALAADLPLAARSEVTMAGLADEAFVALPRSAGALREFRLATDARSAPARVAVEADTAEGAIEAVASGAGGGAARRGERAAAGPPGRRVPLGARPLPVRARRRPASRGRPGARDGG